MDSIENKTRAEVYFKEKFGNKLTAQESWVIRFAIEFTDQETASLKQTIESLQSENEGLMGEVEKYEMLWITEESKKEALKQQLDSVKSEYDKWENIHMKEIESLQKERDKYKKGAENFHDKNMSLRSRLKELSEYKEAYDIQAIDVDTTRQSLSTSERRNKELLETLSNIINNERWLEMNFDVVKSLLK